MEEEDEWPDDPSLNDDYLNWPPFPRSFDPRRSYFLEDKKGSWKKLGKPMRALLRGKTVANNLFDMQHMTAADTSLECQITQRFVAENTGDILCEKLSFAISKKTALSDLLAKVKHGITDARAVSVMETRADRKAIVITGDYKSSPILMFLNINDHPEVHDIGMDIFSHPETAALLKETIFSAFETEKMGMIKWWFASAGDSVDHKEIYLPPLKTVIRPEFYPDLGDPAKYIADYMGSDEAILLLAGPPGTGKTTLLRHLITDYRLSAHVIYDEALMKRDNVFQSFLFDERGDVMIIEDADTILNSREAEGNKLMARFLNVSDGLIKLPNKKLVFTTNITDFGKVDQALLRPGRCFGVMHTRALNLTEAQAAAKAAGLPIPIEKREYTIAELFNQGKKASVRTIGFGARH